MLTNGIFVSFCRLSGEKMRSSLPKYNFPASTFDGKSGLCFLYPSNVTLHKKFDMKVSSLLYLIPIIFGVIISR